MTATRFRVIGGLIAVGGLVGLGALSQVPYPLRVPDDAVLRLSWRVRSHRVEECRRLGPEELAALPPHMRREEVCEGRMLPYHLRVTLDGRTVIDEDVRPAGARADRPLYVFHEITVGPGERRLVVEFEREAVADAGEREDEPGREVTDEIERERGREAPAALYLDRRLMLDPGRVWLVTYDPEAGQLVARSHGMDS